MATDQIEVAPSGPVRARIRPPSSKSITNRALICAALAQGVSRLRHPLASDDTRFLLLSGPGEPRIPDTLFFARRLREAGYSLGPVVVNIVLFDIFLARAFNPAGFLVAVLASFLLIRYRKNFAGIICAKNCATT